MSADQTRRVPRFHGCRQVNYAKLVDGIRAVLKAGEYPTPERLKVYTPHLHHSTIRFYVSDIRKRKIVDIPNPPTKKGIAEPCCKCGTTGGRWYQSKSKPIRRQAKFRDGTTGKACYECWSTRNGVKLVTEQRDTDLCWSSGVGTMDMAVIAEIRSKSPSPFSHTPYDSLKSRFRMGLEAEHAVWAEQALRLASGEGARPRGESAREGADWARRTYRAVEKRLGIGQCG